MRKSELPSVPHALADLQLVDAPTAAAAASISVSAFYALVRDGKAPSPKLRARRMSRWSVADVRAWLAKLAERNGDSPAGEASSVPSAGVGANRDAKAKRPGNARKRPFAAVLDAAPKAVSA